MTILDPELRGKHPFPGGFGFVVAVLLAMTMVLVVSWIGTRQPEPVLAPVADACASDAPGCEMQWMLENLSHIEHPILGLTPEAGGLAQAD